ncbi:MBL fold metallo-hydrolase [Pseudonocardia phyllosphaerae]|uniref:MBL fold metallo-hydrolase n=1 Tax=Pseudonocardia phyllosphaerae TaxID=3390502 RepID=UPI00397861DB
MTRRLRPSRLAAAAALVLSAGAAGLGLYVRREMGASRAELARIAAGSPHARDGAFANLEPASRDAGVVLRMVANMLRGTPAVSAPPEWIPLSPLVVPPCPSALAATWLGHACVLLEVDGRRVLTDPVWSRCASPVPFAGPKRLHPVVAPLDALPPCEVVLLSHDHYDHLDRRTVLALARTTDAVFVAPLGVGAHLRSWGVPAERVVERDHDGVAEVAGLTLTCLPARHFSGRGLRPDTTQWAAWKVAGGEHTVYVGGDSGPSRVHAATGAAHGPFDLTVLPIGAYDEGWAGLHLDPEQAVAAHRALRGRLMLPMHWATFNLGFHPWDEPAERARKAAAADDVTLLLPRPGERVDATGPGPFPAEPWWPAPR